MIDYALKEPKNPNNYILDIETVALHSDKIIQSAELSNFYKSAYKFPFVSSEILSSELNFILDKILPQSEFPYLEESKSYLLNLSTDSYSIKKDENVQEEIAINITLENDKNYQSSQNLLFNPPEIEYGYDKEKEKEREKLSLFYFQEKEREKYSPTLEKEKINFPPEKDFNLSLKDISFNTSIDRKINYNCIDSNSYEIFDYIFSFLNADAFLNSVQSSYLKKIICSLFRNSNKNLIAMKYICFRKSEILFNLMNNIQNREICEIIIKLILTIDNINIEDNFQNYENLKLTIFNLLIQNINTNSNTNNFDFLFTCINVSEIFVECIENTKNFEFFVSESFLNMFTQIFGSLKNKNAIKEFIKVSNSLIKQFKMEYEKAQKFVSSISMSKNIF